MSSKNKVPHIDIFPYLEIRDLLKCRKVCKQWKYLIDTNLWNFHNQPIIYLYKSIYNKKYDWFIWLNHNNIDPHFSRSKNILCFSILYSSPQIIEWYIENHYMPDVINSLEVAAVYKRNDMRIIYMIKEYYDYLIQSMNKYEYEKSLRKLIKNFPNK